MRVVHYCFDADNMCQIYPLEGKNKLFTPNETYHPVRVRKEGGKLIVEAWHGRRKAKMVYRQEFALHNRNVTDSQREALSRAWSLLNYARKRVRRHLFRKNFVSIIIRDEGSRDAFQALMNQADLPKSSFIKPDKILASPLGVKAL